MSNHIKSTEKTLGAAIEYALDSLSDDCIGLDQRDRPYDGQPWTGFAERGKQLVEGLTMRDIRDCMMTAWAELRDAAVECNNQDYAAHFDAIDFLAVCQAAGCNIEKMMGIYPNIREISIEGGSGKIPMIEVIRDDEAGQC